MCASVGSYTQSRIDQLGGEYLDFVGILKQLLSLKVG